MTMLRSCQHTTTDRRLTSESSRSAGKEQMERNGRRWVIPASHHPMAWFIYLLILLHTSFIHPHIAQLHLSFTFIFFFLRMSVSFQEFFCALSFKHSIRVILPSVLLIPPAIAIIALFTSIVVVPFIAFNSKKYKLPINSLLHRSHIAALSIVNLLLKFPLEICVECIICSNYTCYIVCYY